jgi:hypothetical protein
VSLLDVPGGWGRLHMEQQACLGWLFGSISLGIRLAGSIRFSSVASGSCTVKQSLLCNNTTTEFTPFPACSRWQT